MKCIVILIITTIIITFTLLTLTGIFLYKNVLLVCVENIIPASLGTSPFGTMKQSRRSLAFGIHKSIQKDQ